MNGVVLASLYGVFLRADLQGQVIVVILALGSALTWTVMLTKWQLLRKAQRGSKAFLTQFRRERDPLHLYINNFEMPDCPLFNIYRMGAEEVSGNFGNGRKTGGNGGFKSFGGGGVATMTALDSDVTVGERATVNLDTLRSALGRAIDTEVLRFEAQMSILSTAVTGGPFLGLLGSAWGVMSVFASMGEQGTMRLNAVAPGISAALLATVVGLLVAVPSLFGYNLLAARIRAQSMEMESFAEEFLSAVEHHYVAS